MCQAPGFTGPPPMSCGLLREEAIPAKINDFAEDALLRSFSRDIVLWRSLRDRMPCSGGVVER